MTVGFEFCYCEKMYFTFGLNDGTTLDSKIMTMTLDKAIEFVRSTLENAPGMDEIVCCNAETGEVIFIARKHDDDCVEEIDDDPYDIEWDDHYYDDWGNEDMGFDPYLGCYTDDC